MYTFYEGEEAQPKNYLEAYPEHAIPLTMSDDKQPQDKLHLALVFSAKKTPKQPTTVRCLRKRIWTRHLRFNVLRREPEVRLFIHRRI